jgi:putative flippase GtrA
MLNTLVAELVASGFDHVVILDDGSSQTSQHVFQSLTDAGHTVLRHAVNLGKGRALKTGFNHLLTDHPHLIGVVTADADGQHTAADIVKVANGLLSSGARPVLGVRGFSSNVPFRSRFGNTLTRYIFAFVTGVKIGDTQTGLRGLPLTLLPELIALDGERYEYEMTMLAHLCRDGSKPVEIPIETIYIEGNRSSHFNPVWDSMRIYFVLARFFLSSIIAAGVDFLGFSATFFVTHNIAASVAVGRLSSLVNFALNRRFVFRNRGSLVSALWRYYALVVVVAGLSYGLIWALTTRLRWNVFAAKLCVDITLSLVSFSVQRTFIFRRGEVS